MPTTNDRRRLSADYNIEKEPLRTGRAASPVSVSRTTDFLHPHARGWWVAGLTLWILFLVVAVGGAAEMMVRGAFTAWIRLLVAYLS